VLLASLTQYVAVSWIVLILAYLAAAAFIAGRPSTARFGSGLFIAVGVSVLLAAGICTALLSTGRLIA
jgi:hypothetical protein